MRAMRDAEAVWTEDTRADADYVLRKILALRLFEDDGDVHWKRSVTDIDGELLCGAYARAGR
jgi:D-Tyr-tRNAtyr deacylase